MNTSNSDPTSLKQLNVAPKVKGNNIDQDFFTQDYENSSPNSIINDSNKDNLVKRENIIFSNRSRDMNWIEKILYPPVSKEETPASNRIENMNRHYLVPELPKYYEENPKLDRVTQKPFDAKVVFNNRLPKHFYPKQDINKISSSLGTKDTASSKDSGKNSSSSGSVPMSDWSTTPEYFDKKLE